MTELDLAAIILIALGLAADCFAVSVSAGMSRKPLSFWRQLRVPFSFGIFQSLMAFLGWLAGNNVVDLISRYDHWVAFSLLALVGGRMVWESLRHKSEYSTIDLSRGTTLLILSVATSIDALAVGLSMAFAKVNITQALVSIGIIAFIATMLGLLIGRQAGKVIGKRAELVGGIVLIAIGFRILIEHLF